MTQLSRRKFCTDVISHLKLTIKNEFEKKSFGLKNGYAISLTIENTIDNSVVY